MKKVGMVLVVVLILLAVGFLAAMNSRNVMVRRQETVKANWAQVETVLQRRYDLIPNLVNTVKGYAQQEQTILIEVTKYRSQWGAAASIDDKVEAASGMERALSRLLLVSENYPQLKSDANFRALQDELAGTENRIAVERRRYNDAVQAYNVAVRSFPGSVFAGWFGFAPSDAYFQADAPAQKAPEVKF
jgi:LemA protein